MPCSKTSIRICHPYDPRSYLALVAGYCWDADTYTTGRDLGTRTSAQEIRYSAGTETEFIGISRSSNRCRVDVTALERIGPIRTEHRLIGQNCLDYIVSLSSPKLVASEVIGIQNIDLTVLTSGDGHLRYSSARKDCWI